MKKTLHLASSLAVAMTASICLAQANSAAPNQRQNALAFEQQGNNTAAENAWRSVLKSHPADAESYAHLGLIAARQEHYKEAIDFYRKALALKPAFPGLRLNLGLALFKGGDLKEAIAEFKPLLKIQAAESPEAHRITILVGMAYYGLGQFVEAAPYLKKAAAHDPQNLQLRLALAHSCLWSKQYQCVLDVYHEMLTLNADSAEADMLAGEAEDEMKDYDAAIAQFRAAVKANPNQPDAHFGLGYLLWTQKQYVEAVKEFQAELANNPDHTQSQAYLGDTQMQLNNPEAARRLLENVVRVAPNLSLPHLDLGILYADAGRQDDALREMKRAAQIAPEEVDVHWRLARLYKVMGKTDEAKAEFEKASNLHKSENADLLHKMSPHPDTPPIPAEK